MAVHPDIFATGHVRIASRFAIYAITASRHRPFRIKTRRMLYARARNACLTLMHGRCHTVQFHAPFHAWSSLARNFRLTSASIVLRDVSIWNLTFLKDIDIFIRLNNVDVLLIPRQEMFEKSWMAI